MQISLLDNAQADSSLSPLAYRLRPKQRSQYIGIEDLEQRYPFLKLNIPPSMIIFGPPGSGKTALAHVICNQEDIELFTFSAVLSGVAELKKLFQAAQETLQQHRRTPIIFIDEIHRFNKAQQDALLPHVESGQFILIGATTENPRSSVNRALLSRTKIVELKALGFNKAQSIIALAINKIDADFSQVEIDLMADYSGGDARKALANLELAVTLKQSNEYSSALLKKLMLENSRVYDRNKDRHYDVISAFIKSMRGSDPDAAILWLAVMLDGGEDPVFIARRLVIFASEDIGNADLNALSVANNALHVVAQIGMPEARISLAQATTYLASTVKSNAAYIAINAALDYVKNNKSLEVPEHIKNFPAKNHSIKYLYPHTFENGWVEQDYAPPNTPQFYKPKIIGVEKNINNRLSQLWKRKKY